MCAVRDGAPEKDIMVEIIKYDGGRKEPQWMDVQQSMAFGSMTICELGTHSPKDKFEVLCHVAASLSGAPCELERGRFGKMCYIRTFDVVLLVGLTELKAEIRWFDTIAVRVHGSFWLNHFY